MKEEMDFTSLQIDSLLHTPGQPALVFEHQSQAKPGKCWGHR